MNIAVIRHAERLLRESAESLREGYHVNGVGSDFKGEPDAKAAYEEYLSVANELAEMN